MSRSRWYHILKNPKNCFLLIFGFASGLPLALTGNGATFQAWLTDSNVDIKLIGVLAFSGLPYLFKFLWAPLIDRYVPPFLGRRRGWMLITQTVLMISVILMAFIAPDQGISLVTVLAFSIAFFSATQDIAFDAYRTDLLTTEERGIGVSTVVFGYRMAMLVSGALSLIIADWVGWRLTFMFLGLSFLPSLIALWFAPEPPAEEAPRNYEEAVVAPLRALFSKDGFVIMLVLIVVYKLTDAFAEALMTPFLMKGVGFSMAEIGSVNKVLGLIATLFGAFLGGILMTRISLFRALLLFGIFQGLANLSFFALSIVGKDYGLFVFSVIVEKMTSGMGTTAFMAFLMSLCDRKYSATQYALLSAAASLGRICVGGVAGVFVASFGWTNYYALAVMAALPGIALVLVLKERLLAHEAAEKAEEGIKPDPNVDNEEMPAYQDDLMNEDRHQKRDRKNAERDASTGKVDKSKYDYFNRSDNNDQKKD